MAFLFGRAKRLNPLELPPRIRELNAGLAAGDKKAVEEATKTISSLRQCLAGTAGKLFPSANWLIDVESETTPEQLYELVELILKEDTLLILTQRITAVPFESRKDIQAILSAVLRYKAWKGDRQETIAMNFLIHQRPDLLIAMCKDLGTRDSALHIHPVVREVIKNEEACAIVLYDDGVDRSQEYAAGRGARKIHYEQPQTGKGVFWDFFGLVEDSAFDVGAEAFTTFKVRV
jgi:calcium binding protein 39